MPQISIKSPTANFPTGISIPAPPESRNILIRRAVEQFTESNSNSCQEPFTYKHHPYVLVSFCPSISLVLSLLPQPCALHLSLFLFLSFTHSQRLNYHKNNERLTENVISSMRTQPAQFMNR